ncbi:MAG: 30S ribosomal protein S16 [Propionibacteriaceae bacterium]|nr:30S ribosomal protein S16 [Propionibacteriaceae bacterium]
MATKIRLKRMGKIRTPQYRIVVIDERAKRDGRAIEEIGIYQPKSDPSIVEINSERALYWLGVGAQPSDTVRNLLKLSGDWQQFSGDKSPSGITQQPEKADKLAAFNAALAEADDEPSTGAITGRRKKDADADATDEAPAADAEATETSDEA